MPIICGTDFSPRSGTAVEVARALAAQRGDREIIVVHVIEDETQGEAARTQLDAYVASATGPVSIRAELVVGAPEDSLLSFADTEGADLIVVSASSSSPPAGVNPAGSAFGTSLLRLGSTAEKVIAHTRVPVLVVRDPAPWLAFARGERPLRLLLGIDDSVACDLGIQWTHALRQKGSVDVVLGAVYYPDDAAEHYGLTHVMVVDRHLEVEKLITRDLVKKFGSSDHVDPRAIRGLGRIGDHVLELAKDAQVDAILVGTHQKTGLGRLGSVSGVIIHDAPQSVICVPPNAPIQTLSVPRLTSALVATDLSSFANRAVPFAFALTDEGGEVHIAHVVDKDADVDETEVRRALLALAPTGMTRQVSAYILRGEDPAKTIAQAAARVGVDAICIASHGRSGISRALVGSVADKLLRATRKPVLVLRPA